MALPVVYRRKVGRDLAGGFGYYEEQSKGLGEVFLGAVDSSFVAIERYPEMFARIHGEVRRALVSRFPYGIFYRIESKRVVADAIGELECRSARNERTVEAVPEALGERKLDLHPRLEPHIRPRMAKRFFEDRNGEVVVLELGEQNKCLGADRPFLDLGEQIRRDRARTRPLARGELRASRCERST